MNYNGTVLDRLFINQSKEKDHMKHKLAKAKRKFHIASRYFIRAILKPLSETRRLQVEEKVPSLVDRTSHTLSSLIKLREVC